MTWAISHNLPAMQKIVLLMMADHFDEFESGCFLSHDLLAEDCGMNKRSVIRQIDKLVKAGLVTCIKAKDCGGIKNTNKYSLNMDNVGGFKDGCENKDKAKPSSSKKKISSRLRLKVYARDNYACVHCGTNKDLTIDHIYPESKGGTKVFENLQTLCRSCNSRKGTKVVL